MDQRIWRGRILFALLACVLLATALGTAAQVLPSDILQTIESFRRLAILDPTTAGAVWMDEPTIADWQRMMTGFEDSAIGASVWYVNAQAFAATSADGHVVGGLYGPWLGILVRFELDEIAATIVGFTIEPVTDPIDVAADPFDLARNLMDSIEAGAAAFERLVEAQAVPTTAVSMVSDRVAAYDRVIRNAYADTVLGRAIGDSLDDLLAGTSVGPLSLLAEEDPDWVASLTPVWVSDSAAVVLASSVSPLELAWIEWGETTGNAVRVSLIRLFDRVITRGGEDS